MTNHIELFPSAISRCRWEIVLPPPFVIARSTPREGGGVSVRYICPWTLEPVIVPYRGVDGKLLCRFKRTKEGVGKKIRKKKEWEERRKVGREGKDN